MKDRQHALNKNSKRRSYRRFKNKGRGLKSNWKINKKKWKGSVEKTKKKLESKNKKLMNKLEEGRKNSDKNKWDKTLKEKRMKESLNNKGKENCRKHKNRPRDKLSNVNIMKEWENKKNKVREKPNRQEEQHKNLKD